ncbi:angiopoietin-1-like [Apostichopus japonicus]|uniref:angiopoietin-1-like n=1 Tax=Stichopus japonicus TaxID=307972 RepID=UPI003AB77C30
MGVTIRKVTTEASYFFLYQRAEYPRDCHEVLSQCPSSRNDGVYAIKPDGYPEPFEVYCNNSLGDGGWTVIQRRKDSSINFNRTWDEYENGFGFLSHEFWLGNEKISYITNQRKYQLRMDLTTAFGLSFFVTYESFRISDSFSHNKLVSTGGYIGAADTYFEWCPTNKVLNRCKCEGSCADPTCTESCSSTPTCVCPDGFLMDGEGCLPREECGCFIEEAKNHQGVVLAEGEVYVNPSCTKRCSCSSGLLSCDDTYRCSPNGNCEKRQRILQCYCNTGYTGDGLLCTQATTTDCGRLRGEISNRKQNIQPAGWTSAPFQVTCDVTDGGGWLVFQRRVDSSVDFYLYWDDYKDGFGDVDGNFWLGNDKLAALTSQTQYELRIDFVSKSGKHYYAKYSSFNVGNEETNYLLSVSGYDSSSTVGYNAMDDINGAEFSTRDEDNDDYTSLDLTEYFTSGWWHDDYYNYDSSSYYYYYADYDCDLNAPYTGSYTIYWDQFPGGKKNIRSTEMKIRPRI